MVESDLRQMFRNMSDCYADTGRFSNDGGYSEGDVVQALTEDRFIELLKSANILHESNIIKGLNTDDSDINLGDYFLEVGCYDYIHVLVDNFEDYQDYKLPNGVDVVPFFQSDLDSNRKICEYRKIISDL
jgi:hypothetical protein